MSSTTENLESAYQDAAVVSALAAGIAAQLYAFFSDPKNYPRTSGQGNLDNCGGFGGKCPEYYTIGSSCYTAVALNLMAAMNAFILKDWRIREAHGNQSMTKYWIPIAHIVWFSTFYAGLILIIVSLIKYVLAEGASIKWAFMFSVILSLIPFAFYIFMEGIRVWKILLQMLWKGRRGVKVSQEDRDRA
ncbi:hypothetical protein EST38_g3857 [Candolleomyces aberdarensis]|uniref:Uncharacterized protein n=1 Tax=Candolleomyces aberdarensis TaxID=2316362 RepID=A0A4Q2DT23_9AGAR|nr:hypothetical protein EST38_g3857 [Candolleomyces aberdarensis]